MRLGKVIKRVAAAQDNSVAPEEKLLRVRLLNTDGTPSETEITARDTVGAKVGDLVLMAETDEPQVAGMKELPACAAIVAVVQNADAMAREEIPEINKIRPV